MFCKKCGKEIPDDSRYCSYCGTDNLFETLDSTLPSVDIELMSTTDSSLANTIAKKQTDETTKKKKKKDRWIWFLTVGVVLALVIVGILIFPIIRKEKIYQEAVSMYRSGDTSLVEYSKINKADVYFHPERNYKYYQLFLKVEGYKDAHHYILLTKAQSGDLTDKELEYLVSSLDFEDTKEVLVANPEIATLFMLGSWKTSDGKWEYLVKQDSVKCNLPKPQIEGECYYDIIDGRYYIYSKEDSTKRGDCYKIKVIDADTISVFCYEDGITYRMRRQ